MDEASSNYFPNEKQLKSFAMIHYLCTKKCKISPMNSENSVSIYLKSEDKVIDIKIWKLIKDYGGESLEDLYYDL